MDYRMNKYQALNVMIIDDDEFQIEFVTEHLAELGVIQIIKANGGESGLASFDVSDEKPNLLIQYLKQIPEKYKTILLHYSDGFSEREIAEKHIPRHKIKVIVTDGERIVIFRL